MTSIPGSLQPVVVASALLFTALHPVAALAQDNAAAARQGIASPGTAGPTTTKPSPHVSFDGPALKFDFPEVRIGVAEYEEGRF